VASQALKPAPTGGRALTAAELKDPPECESCNDAPAVALRPLGPKLSPEGELYHVCKACDVAVGVDVPEADANDVLPGEG
jgi:hypothetical protein